VELLSFGTSFFTTQAPLGVKARSCAVRPRSMTYFRIRYLTRPPQRPKIEFLFILVPRPVILWASATDRELWQGRKAGSSRITDFRLSAQPQKFETIAVTIGYKKGQLLRLRVILAPARALDLWRWPKGSQLWGREWFLFA